MLEVHMRIRRKRTGVRQSSPEGFALRILLKLPEWPKKFQSPLRSFEISFACFLEDNFRYEKLELRKPGIPPPRRDSLQPRGIQIAARPGGQKARDRGLQVQPRPVENIFRRRFFDPVCLPGNRSRVGFECNISVHALKYLKRTPTSTRTT